MIIPNRLPGVSMRQYWVQVLEQYGAWQEPDTWCVPAFPQGKEFYSRTQDVYSAYIMALNGVNLKTKNQG